MRDILFNDATLSVARALPSLIGIADVPIVIIRDVLGRFRVAINRNRDEVDNHFVIPIRQAFAELGNYAPQAEQAILFRDDFFDPDSVFKNPDIQNFLPEMNGQSLFLLDRTITGQEWLRTRPARKDKPTRIAVYGIKGGVGRSTALAIAAYRLAQGGKNVLVVDLDLESPGLSSLLLPAFPKYGLVDWFVEDAVGQGELVVERMTRQSPLATNTQGQINVVSAIGADDKFFLSKLSRIYGDIPSSNGPIRFAKRVAKVIDRLEEIYTPDVVLLDSRAGLHDIAAISIVDLADYTFLFASNSEATWQGYQKLFSHWQTFPDVARSVRESLKIVYALFPETNQISRSESFLECSYELFLNTLYDEVPPYSEESANEHTAISYDEQNSEAPHYPLRIKWNNRFQEFSLEMLENNILEEADIEASYGQFLEGVQNAVGANE